ncbi:hypothetical protein Btru_025385 [Bulinus truncatus]|nr:hypothetical protein Btru_025385 [Bulinus truncatus]
MVYATFDITLKRTVHLKTSVVNLTAMLMHGGRFAIHWKGNTPHRHFFSVYSTTGNIQVINDLRNDPLKLTQYNITVQATDNGLPARFSNSLLEVVVNRDLKDPVITNLPNTATIKETASPGTSIFKADARGPIQMYDTNWPNNKVTRNLTVNVIRNENGPVFTGPSTANINTNFPPGETVLLLIATDADGDRLTVSKVNPNDNSSSNFIVDSTTGRIILIKPLSGPGTYAFDVLVTDNCNPAKTSTQTVRINVSSGTVSLPPSFVNAPYTQQSTSMLFPTGNLKYRIVGGVPGDAERFFRTNENNGRVSLTQRLDNSPTMNNRYSVVLFIEAYDDKVPSEAIPVQH